MTPTAQPATAPRAGQPPLTQTPLDVHPIDLYRDQRCLRAPPHGPPDTAKCYTGGPSLFQDIVTVTVPTKKSNPTHTPDRRRHPQRRNYLNSSTSLAGPDSPLSATAWTALRNALNGTPRAQPCTQTATQFVVLYDGGFVEIELDGCHRVLTPDYALRQATPSLLALLT